MIESILSGLGSIASIIGLIFAFKSTSINKKNIILLIIIFLLTLTTSILTYRNHILSDPENVYLRRVEMASTEAKKILDTFPNYFNEYSTGDNEGIILAGIVLLEKYKDLFSESFALIKENSLSDIKKAKASEYSTDYQTTMENSARAMYQVIKSIAGNK